MAITRRGIVRRSYWTTIATLAAGVAMVCMLLMSWSTVALSSGARAGSVIANQAYVVYRDLVGTEYQAWSNRVATIVSAVPGVDITAGGVMAARPGGSARFEHMLTNTGNSPDFIDICVDGPEGFAFEIGFERDGNASPDAGLLEPGESILLCLVVQVPDSTPLSTVASFAVVASSALDGSARDTATDIVAVNAALPRLDVYGSPLYAYLGTEYSFRIGFGNDGDISVDGAMLQSQLPDALDLVDADGECSFSTAARTLTWPLGTIAPGQNDDYTVRVRVIEATPGISYVLNRAVLTSSNGPLLKDQESTGLVTSAPSGITLQADPKLVPGDGRSTSVLTAEVVDALGNPVPDGTPVTFHTELGTFRENSRTYYSAVTVDGRAKAILVAPLISGLEPVSNDVMVRAGNPETGEAHETITIVFSPAGVTGIVQNASTGLPIPGIPAQLNKSDGQVVSQARTDAFGRYLLVAPAVGTYTVSIAVPSLLGALDVEMPVDVGSVDGAVFSTACAIIGRLAIPESPSSATAVGTGAAVALYDASGSVVDSVLADSNGEFGFTGLPTGRYTITASTDDGFQGLAAVQISEDGEVLCEVMVWLHQAGLVYDASTHAPIPGASVRLVFASGPSAGQPVALTDYPGLAQSNPTLTTRTGRYIFYASPGHYALQVSAFGYEDYASAPSVLTETVVNASVPMVRPPASGLSLAKRADRASAAPGERIRFELACGNISGHDLADVTLVDKLPPDLKVHVDSISAGGVYDTESHSITWVFPVMSTTAETAPAWFDASAVGSTPDGTTVLNRAQVCAADGSLAAATASVLIARKPGIWIIKDADRPEAAVGDMITYRIVVGNSNSIADPMIASSVNVHDVLPAGFRYVLGSTRLDGEPAGDPDPCSGVDIGQSSSADDCSVLLWRLGQTAPGETHELIYKASVGPDALRGDGANIAHVQGTGEHGYPFEVGPASARVNLSGPAFPPVGAIIGRVYQAADGRGIAGAELFMDNGVRVVTDADGLYHVSQVSPGSRSIRLNLPDTGSPSRFVRVLPSGVARADFAVALPEGTDSASAISLLISSPEFLALTGSGPWSITVDATVGNHGSQPVSGVVLSVAARSVTGDLAMEWIDDPVAALGVIPQGASVERRVRVQLSSESALVHPDSLLIMAAVHRPGEVLSQASTVTVVAPAAPAADTPVSAAATVGYSILSPAPQSLSPQGHMSIRVASPLYSQVALAVNGVTVAEEQIGGRSYDSEQGVATLEYFNVQLQVGKNVIELRATDTGVVMAEADVYVPGPATGAVALTVPTGSRLARGARIPATALAIDEFGLPAGRLAGVDSTAYGADFVGNDADPGRSGFQTHATGRGTHDLLLSVADPDHDIVLNVHTGCAGDSINLRDLLGGEAPAFVAGSAELHLNMLEPLSSYAVGRAYLRKEFSGSVLTLGIDTTRQHSASEDVVPYSIYGDDSVQSDAAPSQGMLYVKFAKGDSYAMWGDFQPAFGGLELVGVRSALTGFSASTRAGRLGLVGFAAPTHDTRFTDIIEGNGSSGYYFLSTYPVIPISEAVRVLHTSYNDQSIILDSKSLVRGVDYTIDYSAGAILLSEPLPSTHAGGGKALLEVAYTALAGAQRSTVAGARATLELSTGAGQLGVSGVFDVADGSIAQAVAGVDLSMRFGRIGAAFTEVALSTVGDSNQPGLAARAGLKLNLGQFTLRADGAMSDGIFTKLGEDTPIPCQASVNAELVLDEALKTVLSFRTENIRKGRDAGWTSSNSVKVGRRLPLVSGLAVGGIATVERSKVGLGLIVDAFAEASITSKLSATATAQLLRTGPVQDRDGDFLLSLTYRSPRGVALTLGYSTEPMPTPAPTLEQSSPHPNRRHSVVATLNMDVGTSGKLYSRLDLPLGSAADTSARAVALGYKDTYVLAPGLRLLVAAEGSTPLDTSHETDAGRTGRIAASAALQYTSPTGLSAYARQEATWGASGRTSLTQLNVKGKAAPWLSLGADLSAYAGTSPTREGLPLKVEGAISAVARPLNGPVTALAKITGKYFGGHRFGHDESTTVVVASTDCNLELGSRLSLQTKAALKLVAEGARGNALTASSVLLLQVGPSVHIGPGADVQGFLRALGWAGRWRSGHSVQVVQTIFDGLSLAVGYNSADLADTDIGDPKPWAKGPYIKAMFKF